ncbi:non-ribosomal peptide synthetase [Ketobacter sp.]|uniref:non-ribosomal peptide synthetase n=1 Tax=Ketobacter sp. TaxID=2083498 RepID=UPI000F0DCC96|nr:non-ribosomal peptide synthetase [Ketobacter sp.]RLT97980.1 MAG: amino acid adenylation domain-containing protein [Ketobacter sp.]
MNVVEFLASLAKQDIRLWLEGENLRFSAPEGAFTPEIRDKVVANKPAIIEFLRQARKLNEAAIEPVSRDQALQTSYGQQRLWILDQLNPHDVTYNMSSALRIKGPLRGDVLEKVLRELVKRHESLRTCFDENDGEPVQRILPADGWSLLREDLSAMEPSQQQAAVDKAVSTESLTPYDLKSGPLFRARLLVLGADHHVLIAGMHHIISDAWSMEVLVKELSILYMAFSSGMGSPLPPLPIQYADYSAWQRQQMAGEDMQKHMTYWQETLAGAPAVLALPTDRPRQDIPSNNGALKMLPLPAALADKINRMCSELDVTPFMFFLGAWQLLLGRYADSQDVVIGSPIAGRSRSEVQELIGFFVNLLLMRLDLSGNPSVETFYQRVKNMALGAFSHQDLPIDRLLEVMAVERQPGYPPLAQAAFQLINLQDASTANPFGDAPVQIEAIPASHVAARMDMVLGVAKTGDQYEASLEYNTDLFNDSTVAGMMDQYLFLLDALASDRSQLVDEIQLYNDAHLLQQMGFDADTHDLLALNANQHSMVLDQLAHPHTIQNAYGIYVDLPLRPDVRLLEQAIQALVDACAVLRTKLVECSLPAADMAYAVMPKHQSISLEVIDLSQEHWLDYNIHSAALKLMHRAYDIFNEPLLRYYLLHQGEQYRLVLACHHIVLDGASTYLFMQQVLSGYQQLLNGMAFCPPLDEGARRFLSWSSTQTDTPQVLDYWRQRAAEVEPLNFSFSEYYREPGQESEFGDVVQTLALDHRQLATIREYCVQHGINLPLYFKTLFGLMLQHYCRPDSGFSFAEFFACRQQEWADALGCFYQQFPSVVAADLLSAGATLVDWQQGLKASRDLARSFRTVSLRSQQQILPSGRATFMFNFYNFVNRIEVAGAELQPVMSAPKVDGGVQFIVKDLGDTLELELRYDAAVFNGHQFLPRLMHLNEQVQFDPPAAAAQLQFLSAAEGMAMRAHAHVQPLVPGETVVHRFQASAEQWADNVAVMAPGAQLTYAELNAKANQLAHTLIEQGVTANVRVGICLDRSTDLLVAILGVLKAGGAYVPLDPAYPKERLAYMLEDAAAPLVITASCHRAVLGDVSTRVLELDSNAQMIAQKSTANPDVPIDPASQIYVIYTSGSTGRPKGAMVKHSGEMNLQHWYLDLLGLSHEDCTLLVSAVGFDLTQKNLFAPLMVGASIVMPAMELYDEHELLNLIRDHGVTWVNCAPSAFYPIAELAAADGYKALRSVRYLVLGGEPIRLSPLYHWLTSANSQAQLVNSYGPTECTDVVSYHVLDRIENDQQMIPIGKPVPNTELLLLNENLQAVVPGCVGEICVAGAGVGLGYINRPELTAQVFVDVDRSAGKVYRTGDLGRLLPNGDIEYLGRKDFQIKLRGLRIELGEIEFALKRLPAVQDSLVLVHEDRLIAYLVAQAEPPGWRETLRDHLPEYMIPALLICLPSWPLTPNGKVDRKALPDPELAVAELQVYVAPRTPTEQTLVGIWQEVLQRSNIGVMDNLFDVGGNSLLATRIVSRIKKQFEIPLGVRELFVAPTVAELAMVVERANQTRSIPPIEPLPDDALVPLSYAQQRLWFLDQLEPGSTAYNMPGAFRLSGRINIQALQQTLYTIVERHAVLRTTMTLVEDEPVQQVLPADHWQLQLIELATASAEQKQARIHQEVEALYGHQFDLGQGPLFYVKLLVLDAAEFVLLINMHHIVTDGWSNGILMRELGMLYDAYSHGRRSPLPDLKVQYRDFAQWQRQWLSGAELERQLSYWRQALAGVEVLNLPTNYPRTADTGFAGNVLSFELDANLSAKLNALCKRQGVSLYMATLAAYMVLLSKYSGQQDIAVGSPIANRNFEDIEPLIGFFVNTLVVRGELASDMTFTQLLAQVQQKTLDSYAHQDVPFERLVDELVTERDMLHAPLFQVLFSLQNVDVQTTAGIPGIELQSIANHQVVAKFDLEFSMMEQGEVIAGEVVYRTGLFDKGFIQRLIQHYITVLESVVQTPDTRLDAVSLITPDEAQQLFSWNDTSVEYDRTVTVHQLIEAQVDQTPDAPALIQGERVLSYLALEQRANQLARYLQQKGVVPGDVVAIMMARSPELMVSILAVMKAGATYLPLDPSYPADRIDYMLQDSSVSVLLADDALRPEQEVSVSTLVMVGDITTQLDALSAERLPPQGNADTLLYVIYTSGSTGRPKGTGARHRAEVNLLNWYCRDFAMSPRDRVLLISAVGFDLTQKNFFAPLVSGAALVMPRSHHYDPYELLQDAGEHRVTWINCAPNAFYPLLEEDPGFTHLQSLRWVFLGGEPIDFDRVATWIRQGSGKLVNSYGPTECADIATYHVVENLDHYKAGTIPIGRAIDNVKLYIVDEQLQLVPQGVPGELCIGGESVGPGYFNNPQQTADRFVANPYLEDGSNLYRTGDLARYLSNGEIEYLGRIDAQVKIRGFRIEPGEIEMLLRQMDGISASCVVVREDSSGQKILVGYVVSEQEYSQSDFRAYLQPRLPEFMIPAAVVTLPQMPLTPNGKVAKNQLPAPLLEAAAEREIVAPQTDIERRVLAIWQAVLQQDALSIDDDFFAVGGQSLLATQVMSRLRREFAVNVPLRALFEAPTIRNIGQQVELALSNQATALPPVEVIDRSGHLPLSFVQQQLWLLDQLDPGTAAYNMPVALRIHGDLDVEAFKHSFNQIIVRHETLRTNFKVIDGEPVAVIHAAAADQGQEYWDLEYRDLSAEEPIAREAALQQLIHEQMDRGFNLQSDRLLRGVLVRLDDSVSAPQHAFVGAVHHIVSDGWSLNVMTAELMELYQAAIEQRQARLPELTIQYVDVAAWQRKWLSGETLQEHVQYWRDQLDNDGQVLQLQSDFPRPAVMTSNGAVVKAHVAPAVVRQLNTLAQEEGATLFMVLVAAYQLLLQKYTGQERINVGTPIAGRDSIETEQLVGFFINTVVLSTEVHPELTVRELVRQVREVTLGAYAHQALPFEKLVEALRPPRDSSRTPFFQVFINLLNLPPQADGRFDLNIEPLLQEDNHSHAKYDFNLYVSEEGDGSLDLVMVYNTDLYRPDTAQGLLNHLAQVLGSLNDRADQALAAIKLVDTAAVDWMPDLTVALPKPSCSSPLDLFLRHAREDADRVAVRCQSGTITFGELEQQSRCLAQALVARGIQAGDLVSVLATRSPDLIIALLGILRAGAAFNILDSGYPAERLHRILTEARPALLLDATAQATDVSGLQSALGSEPGAVSVTLADLQQESGGDPFVERHDPHGLAYVAFTSGSTGKPKGIKADFQPLAHFVEWYWNAYQISAEDRISMMSGLAHDPLLRDIFVPLAIGASIVIPAADWMLNPEALFQWYAENQISVSHLTPSMARMLLDTAPADAQLDRLRLLGIGGDRLPRKVVAQLTELAPDARIAAFYGATETPQVMATFDVIGEVDSLPEFMPVGRGIEGVDILLLDPSGALCAPGQVGEIAVRTPYLSQGYLNSDDSVFALNPHSAAADDRIYHTGDKGRYRADGMVEFLGRLDQQIKIRGFRVEPEEVESAIVRVLGGNAAATVVAGKDPRGDDCLVAYVAVPEADSDSTGDQDALRMQLRNQLPEYMVPALFIPLQRIPLTRNGKVDKRSLPMPDDFWVAREYVAPRTEYEEQIAAIWQTVLKVEQISVVDNFFDVGGHSLLAVQIVSRVKEQYQIEFSMRRLMEIASIEGMASYVENALWVRGAEEQGDDAGDDFEELEI